MLVIGCEITITQVFPSYKGVSCAFHCNQERLRAATLGYEDPILPSFDATTKMYENALTEVLRQINERERGKIAVMVATHNEDTVRMTINKCVISFT